MLVWTTIFQLNDFKLPDFRCIVKIIQFLSYSILISVSKCRVYVYSFKKTKTSFTIQIFFSLKFIFLVAITGKNTPIQLKRRVGAHHFRFVAKRHATNGYFTRRLWASFLKQCYSYNLCIEETII